MSALLLSVLLCVCRADFTFKSGTWSTTMVLGRQTTIAWTSTNPASIQVKIELIKSVPFYFDTFIATVVSATPNSGSYVWNSPRTLAVVIGDEDYYFRISGDGDSKDSATFKLVVPNGKLSIDWQATLKVGSKTQILSAQGAVLQASLPVRINWTSIDIDSSNKLTISLAKCKDCSCVRSATQGAISGCGLLSYFDNVCLIDVPDVAANLPATSGSLNTTIHMALEEDDCVFYYAQMQPRSEYTARSRMFKISSQAIALTQTSIKDWPLGETRNIEWTVLRSLNPADTLRIYVFKSGRFSDVQLYSSPPYKVVDRAAMFTLPSSLGEQPELYLELKIVSGAAKDDFTSSEEFSSLAPSQPTASLRLSGLTLNPFIWPALERRSIYFTGSGFTDLVKFPNTPIATISLVDENPYAKPAFSLKIGQISFREFGALSFIMPINVPASSEMRIVVQSGAAKAQSNPFVVAPAVKCLKVGNHSALCDHVVNKAYPIFVATDAALVLQQLRVSAQSRCGGAVVLSFNATISQSGAAAMTANLQSDLLRSGSTMRELLIKDELTSLYLGVDQLFYNVATRTVELLIQLAEPEAKVSVVLAKRLIIAADVSLVSQCDQPAVTNAGAEMTSRMELTLPVPTLDDEIYENRCVADFAACDVLCAPYFTKQCSCTVEGVVSAVCVERDSSFMTTTCVRAVDLGTRCRAVCNGLDALTCECNKDDGTKYSCDSAAGCGANYTSECNVACGGAMRVTQCSCDMHGRVNVQCDGLEEATPAPTTPAPFFANEARSRKRSGVALIATLLAIIVNFLN